jgi:ABC-type antimicrobial peptide transport system permease subunit
MSFKTVLTDRRFRDSTRRAAFIEELESRLGALPGVQAAGAGSGGVPLFGRFDPNLTVVGESKSQPGVRPLFVFDVSPGYLAAAGMRLVRGRTFTSADRPGGQPVALVNETAARHHWAGRDPVGQRLKSGTTEYAIVGVVNDVRTSGSLDDPPFDAAFFAASQSGPAYLTFIVRSALPLSALTPRIRAEIEELAPGQPIFGVRTLDQTAQLTRYDYHIMTELLVVLGAAALVLAVIGVYEAMSHAVAQRVPEIGIRRALGAQARDVLQLLARHGGLMVGLGSLLGIPLAFGMARLVGSVLPGVRTFDGVVFSSIPLALAITAAIATLVPARRAIRVDALVALRSQ